MAKEGKKLELYEILAAKRAKGKSALGFDSKPAPEETVPVQAPEPPRSSRIEQPEPGEPQDRMVIIDDALDQSAVDAGYANHQQPLPAERPARIAGRSAPLIETTVPESRPRAPREVVLALDTAFIVFVIVVALAGSSYFIGYKRGQEERPTGLVGLGDIQVMNADHLNLRHLSPPARTALIPPDQDYTLVLRTEPASESLPERLEYELAEAMARGSREAGVDVQGFIFRNAKGNDIRFVLAVGLGRTPNDAELQKLLQIYNRMEGITLSREPRPYIGCQIAPIRDLGVPVD